MMVRIRPRSYVAALALALTAMACGGGTAVPPTPESGGTAGGVAVPASTATPTTSGSTPVPPPDTTIGPELRSVLTFTEYHWIFNEVIAVVDLEFPESTKKRVLTGDSAWRHPSGNIVFAQGCGQQVARVTVASPVGGLTPVTPCSVDIENPGVLNTDFGFARSSPNESRIAVEAKYFLDDQYRYSVVIYEDGEMIQVFDDHWAPTWLDDDTVLLAGGGLFVADIGEEPTAIDGGVLASGTNNPDIHPTGERVVFEWNQQLWMLNLDGSELTELVTGPSRYRFPVWSPDGAAIAFLATADDDRYDRAIYFRDMESGEFVTLDITDQLGDTAVPFGPLAWTTYLGE